MDKFYLVHYTPIKNLDGILAENKLLDNLGRKRNKMTAEGEGSIKRKCCYPTNTYKDIQEGKMKCNEGCGVYFRVVKDINKIKKPFKNQVAFVFGSSILKKHKWHINFCENNGLWINDGIPYFGDDSNECPTLPQA